MDGQISNPKDWERLFEIREDGMFYMGDYVQADAGELKEIRFDRVYANEEEMKEDRNFNQKNERSLKEVLIAKDYEKNRRR